MKQRHDILPLKLYAQYYGGQKYNMFLQLYKSSNSWCLHYPCYLQQSSLLMYLVARSPTLFLVPHGHQLFKIGLVYEAPIWYSLSRCYTVRYLHTHWIIKTHSISRASSPRWRHQMETLSALLAHCAGNSPVTDDFPTQRPVTQSFDVFFHLRVNLRRQRAHYGVIVMQYYRGVLGVGIPIIKITLPGDSIIVIVGIPILALHLHIETSCWVLSANLRRAPGYSL